MTVGDRTETGASAAEGLEAGARGFNPYVRPARFLARDILGRSNDEAAAGLRDYQDEARCRKRVTRVRRAAPATSDGIDRLPAPGASLAEHLCWQLSMGRHDSRMLALAAWIIGNLDPDGYLRESLSELAALVGSETAELEKALAVVQSLEPTGVGATSLRECLLLQLRAQADSDPVAIELVDRHLPALSRKQYDDVALALGQPVERVLRALAAIRRLEPRPGRSFGDAPVPTVRPEVTIERSGDEYRVVVLDEGAPQMRVRQRSGPGAAGSDDETRGDPTHPVQSASWLITAFERRRLTVRGVVESIVRRQPDFLAHGPSRVRPLSFRRIAADVGRHESTVSRAVAHRYVDTPHGVFPLRFFFGNGLAGDPAGGVSPLAVRHRIREIVDAEDPTCPMADGRIAETLAASGIRIARRTVVKYRELLGIGSAPRRRAPGGPDHGTSPEWGSRP